ncbi:MAG: GNAT family N-acetyltransferase [Candidatus Sericytochromatia bacterium]|nr:GNAT family N-acetyltransferase [Candidatus Sericytochromatia bacterium]
MSGDQPVVRMATAGDAWGLVTHLDRHMAESGSPGTPVFTPIPAGSVWHDELLFLQLQDFWQRPLTEFGWGRCWIVQTGQSVVGALVLRGATTAAGLHRATLAMGLEADFRRRRLGAALLQHAVAWSEQQSEIAWLDLRVFAHNVAGLALYGRHGFAEIGRVVDFMRIAGEPLDDILMARRTPSLSTADH